MNNVSIIAPAIDIEQLARSIAKEHIALQDDERHADSHEKKGAGYRESAARRRVEIGRMLIEAKRGVKHGQWLPWLAKIGIDERNARNWMLLAGYVDAKSETQPAVSDLPFAPSSSESRTSLDTPVPTLRDAGIDKRPRKAEVSKETPAVVEAPRTPPALDIDRELWSLHDKICKRAETWTSRERALLAHQLRETAKLIEDMR